MKLFLFNILLLLFSLTTIYAEDWKAQLKAANTAYGEGKYQEAVDAYKAIEAAGYTSTTLHFNLGNAYYQLEKTAPAILQYERALRLSPNDEAVQSNLKLATERITQKTDTYPILFYKRWWLNTIHAFSAGMWSFWALLLIWGAFSLAVLFTINKVAQTKKRLFASSIFAFGLAILSLVFAYNKYQLEQNQQTAIVFVPDTDLQAGPSTSSKLVTSLAEGIKVKVVDQVDDWTKIILTDDRSGWVNSGSLTKI